MFMHGWNLQMTRTDLFNSSVSDFNTEYAVTFQSDLDRFFNFLKLVNNFTETKPKRFRLTCFNRNLSCEYNRT